MKIAIIGAGGAGLAAAKYSAENGFECEVFEQTGLIGGIWNYTDQVGVDDYGLPVHTSMYKGLMTNVPKELMYYPDFPYPDNLPSYIEQEKVLQYIHDYAKHFDLYRHIKFYKHVTRVHPVLETKWEVTIRDVKDKTEETKIFDAVMVCKGNFNNPRIPCFPKSELFRGNTMHSHDYRCPNKFKGKRVLVIGAGPSGRDIANLISPVAEKVVLSLEKPNKNHLNLPVIKEFYMNGVIFLDDKKEEIDEVIYCTGYTFEYPFLTKECGITIEDNWIQPLYKHIININHPTMGFIGKPFLVCCFPLFDIQVRFFLSTLNGHFSLPRKEEMFEDLKNYVNDRDEKGIPRRNVHQIGETQGDHFEDLANTAKIKPIPPVISKLYLHIKKQERKLTDCYKIIDDETFVQTA